MDVFLQQVINGLVQGSMYALIALGYTMVYGIINLINFAHGEVLMVAALTSWSVIALMQDATPGMPGWLMLIVSLVIASVVAASLNFAIEKIAYRPLRNSPKLAPLITASTCPLQVSMPDLAAGVAAARKADVFIGMHGECRMQGGTTRGCVPRNPGSACCTGAPVWQRGRHQTYRLPSSRLPARSVSACLQAPTWATAG